MKTKAGFHAFMAVDDKGSVGFLGQDVLLCARFIIDSGKYPPGFSNSY